MNQYFSKKSKLLQNDHDIDFQILQWYATDDPVESDDNDNSDYNCNNCGKNDCSCKDFDYNIRCFGRTSDGKSITCKILNFKPFYFIKVDDAFNKQKMKIFLEYIKSHFILKYIINPIVISKCLLIKKKDIYGFRNGKEYKFIKIVFKNLISLNKSKYIFKKPLQINGITSSKIKFKLYESNFEPYLRFCHIKEILTAGWARLPGKKYTATYESSTQLEYEIDKSDIVKIDISKMASFLQASWDIEVYSHDGTFPSPLDRQNCIFQIATTYKYNNSDKTFVKHLLTLKKCSEIDDQNTVVEECENETALIKKWVFTISKMDPDIIYTYNGDSFDFRYIMERSKILGLLSHDKKSGYIIEKLSRLNSIKCDIKKEMFQSGAYGDNEYFRMYIPGRLNYDLLIHYKRGLKKYSSYKLDSIASEILEEGKHDVSAKDIFGYYKDGTPDKIKKIGLYCLQDTELLQKLVDKQMILTNIIQLANVTYVPIEYLITKGQTIKVYSQLLRKARQMNFLVPHTNFNNDSYNICIKTKNENVFNENDIGKYIDINDLDILKTSFEGVKSTIISNVSLKILEIVDCETIIAITDVELVKDYLFKKGIFKKSEFIIKKLYQIDEMTDDSFTGASVLTAKKGLHTDNVAVLDFASLYPTIQISRNLCFSTVVMDNKFENLKDVNYEIIKWDDKIEYKMNKTCEGIGKSGKSKDLVCGKQAFFEVNDMFYCRIHNPNKKQSVDSCTMKDITYNFMVVQPSTDINGNISNKGVIPSLLEELYTERKNVKKQMAKAHEDGDKLLSDILDSTQLAIKISLNSVYGFLSRTKGNLICKPIGQMTTAIGRMLIKESQEYAENAFSDFINTNNIISHDINKVNIENLSDEEKNNILNCFVVKN